MLNRSLENSTSRSGYHPEFRQIGFKGRVADSHRVMAVFNRLDKWDLDVVKTYIVEQGTYPRAEVDVVEREYRRWMSLAITHPDMNIAMSRAVDNFWHMHILFTQNYTAMCHAIFGKYIHHRPCILDSQKELDRFFKENTIELYRLHFGDPDPKYWNVAICQYCSHTIEQ